MGEAIGPIETAWDQALAAIPDQAAWIEEQLSRVRDNPALSKDGKGLQRAARPRFMDDAVLDADQAVVTAVTAALDAAASTILADPELSRRCLGPWAQDARLLDLFSLPAGYPQHVVFGRFDGVRGPDGMRILEFNGGLPGGLTITEASAAVMSTWPAFAEVSASVNLHAPRLFEAIATTISGVWHAFGGSGTPRVAFVVPREFQDYVAAQMRVLLASLRSHGLEVSTCDPDELVRRDGKVHGPDGVVDVAIRVFFTSMLPALGGRLDTMVEAVRAGELCMVTSFRAGLLGHKSLFAVITDPGINLGLPEEIRELVRAHVPWSRIMTDASASAPDGSIVDLREYALAEAAHLVLKPAEGTGGAGVLLGWEQDAEAWRAAIDSALSSPDVWIIQERIPLTFEELPVLEDGFPLRHFQADHNPLVFNDRIGGYFVRLSETGGITNVTSGDGTVIPTYFVS